MTILSIREGEKMIIEIDSDYLEGKTEEEISKMIVDILKCLEPFGSFFFDKL